MKRKKLDHYFASVALAAIVHCCVIKGSASNCCGYCKSWQTSCSGQCSNESTRAEDCHGNTSCCDVGCTCYAKDASPQIQAVAAVTPLVVFGGVFAIFSFIIYRRRKVKRQAGKSDNSVDAGKSDNSVDGKQHGATATAFSNETFTDFPDDGAHNPFNTADR